MNTRLRLAIVLAAVAGGLLATAGSFAYAQSTTQQAGQTSCGSMNSGGMGMMGGMTHYGTMNQGQCRAQMGQHGMGQCQGYIVSEAASQHYGMMQGQNATQGCY